MVIQTVLSSKSSATAIADIKDYAIHLMHSGRASLSGHLFEEQTRLAQLLSEISEGIELTKARSVAAEIVFYCIMVGDMASCTWLKHDKLVVTQVEVMIQQLLEYSSPKSVVKSAKSEILAE